MFYTGSKRSTLLHSFSTSDAHIGEYKYTVTVGEDSLKITGSNLDLVRVSKMAETTWQQNYYVSSPFCICIDKMSLSGATLV